MKPTDTEFPPGHTPRYVSTPSGMIDSYECSCGWKSGPYYDGAEYAWTDWKRHVEHEMKRKETRMFSEEQIARYKRLSGKDGWIAVDFDGTMAEYSGWVGAFEFGAPIPLMIQRIKAWIEMGLTVKILSARVPESWTSIQHCRVSGRDWTRQDMVDAFAAYTLEHVGVALDCTCVKDLHMIELWDDRAVQVVPNTGRTLSEEHAAELSALRGAP